MADTTNDTADNLVTSILAGDLPLTLFYLDALKDSPGFTTPDIPDSVHGLTPLQAAVGAEHVQRGLILQALLIAKARPNLVLGREGISAMDKAKQLGNWEAVQVMEKWEHGGKEGSGTAHLLPEPAAGSEQEGGIQKTQADQSRVKVQEEHAQDEINEGREVYAQWLLKRILAKQIHGNLRYILLDDTTISESAEVISKSKVGGH